jgi:hypothetical protein
MALENITIPVSIIVENKLSINDYLILYDIASGGSIKGLINCSIGELVSLEQKGFIKLADNTVYLRDKASVFFSVSEDLFLEWLKTYPVQVKRKHGGKRALSPDKEDTILGKKLRKKWTMVFKKNIEAQRKAIRVLELQLKDMSKSGDLEYMVEASRWLNEGYHEKYSYLLDSDKGDNLYENEDYM